MGTIELLGRGKRGSAESPTLLGPAAFDPLEPRLLLSADALPGSDGDAPCAPADEVSCPVLEQLVRGNNAFAFDLYQAVRDTQGSLFLSPFSISAALSMTYAGAAGRTAEQMAEVLHFTLPEDLHHMVFGELIEMLQSADGATPPGYESGDAFTLNIANSLWGQEGEPFRQEVLDLVAQCYGGPLYRTDFLHDTEGSRQRINQWVSDKTQEKITDLLQPGDVTWQTILVLVNALYFLGSWDSPFEDQHAGTFHLPDEDLEVEMMAQTHAYAYAEGDDYQAVELPYVGDASMLLLLPKPGQFEGFEASLSAEKLEAILGTLDDTEVHLTMPLFDFRTHVELQEVLERMGMTDAFYLDLADFTRMTPVRPLAIFKVVHEACVSVGKEGTEAAAATAVVMFRGSPPPPPQSATMVVDRPFLFLIRDQATDTTLFVGRLSDASGLIEAEGPGPDPDLEPPTVVGVEVIQQSAEIVITFSEPVSIAGEAVLVTASPGAAEDPTGAALEHVVEGQTATLSFPQRPSPGLYTLTIRGMGVQDRAANPLDGDGDGTGGDDYATELMIAFPGDATLDGEVNYLDYLTLKRSFGAAAPADWSQGDSNADGKLDRLDFLAMRDSFGKSLGGAAPAADAGEPAPAADPAASGDAEPTCAAGETVETTMPSPAAEAENAATRDADRPASRSAPDAAPADPADVSAASPKARADLTVALPALRYPAETARWDALRAARIAPSPPARVPARRTPMRVAALPSRPIGPDCLPQTTPMPIADQPPRRPGTAFGLWQPNLLTVPQLAWG
jgi:serpin B